MDCQGDKSALTKMGTSLNEGDDDLKKTLWKNIGRITSARPGTRQLSMIQSVDQDSADIRSKVTLDDVLNWDTSHWSNWNSEVYGFASKKPERKPCRDMELQTEPVRKVDSNLGGVDKVHVKTQTEFDYDPDETPSTGRTFLGDPYPPSLFAFVSKVGPRMITEVRENIRLNQLFSEETTEDEVFYHKGSILQGKEAKFEFLRALPSTQPKHRLRTKNLPEGENLEASCVSWSPTGRQLAVGHGSFRHDGFCRHHSIPLTIWTLVEPLLKDGPLHEVRFDGCITCVQFHPKYGYYLAFGLQSGEVGLMNLNGADEKPVDDIVNPESSRRHPDDTDRFEFKQNDIFVNTNASAHALAVTVIRWIRPNPQELKSLTRKNPSPTPYLLVTTSLDGYMALWSLDKSGRLTLERRYALHTREIPESFKKQNRSSYMYIKEIGIQAWDSFATEPTRFVCSTYGSFLFTGNLLSDKKYSDDELANPRPSVSDIYDPEAVVIKQELDYVRCLACNPSNPYLYIYGTQFGNLFIRNVKFNTGEPILETYLANKGTYDVKWSLRPMVFGVTNSKQVYIYDLTLHQRVEVMTLQHEADCRAIDWNKNEFNLLAVADSQGYVNIWKVPAELQNEDELEELSELSVYAAFTDYTEALVDEDDLVEEAGQESDDLEVLDELTKNHFPVLNSKLKNQEGSAESSQSTESD